MGVEPNYTVYGIWFLPLLTGEGVGLEAYQSP